MALPRFAVPAAISLLLTFVATAPASARTGPCLPEAGSPQCHFWTAKTLFVADGDTIHVDVAGDGSHRMRPIRITGLNAMEMTRYSKYPSRRRGECHALAATAALEKLIRVAHGRVRLAAQEPASRSGHRLRRQVAVHVGGHWVDVAERLIADGHALWLPNSEEWAWNRDYEPLAKGAQELRLNLWNPRGCGVGPASNAGLAMHLNYDADGNDFDNVDGEWARISTSSPLPVHLGGWWFRDSALRRYRFPSWAEIPANGSIILRMGKGRSAAQTFFWGLSEPPLENPSYDRRGIGDGGYLFDPKGNLRVGEIYP
jgi:micrococcal nuclease